MSQHSLSCFGISSQFGLESCTLISL